VDWNNYRVKNRASLRCLAGQYFLRHRLLCQVHRLG
jgi:hypothetical protein